MEQPGTTRRSGFRFSLKTLLLAVVPVAIGAAALRGATYAWATAIVTLTLLGLFAAIIAAMFDGRYRRPLWLGFAFFCGAYLLVIGAAPTEIVNAFGTEQLNRLLLQKLHPNAVYTDDAFDSDQAVANEMAVRLPNAPPDAVVLEKAAAEGAANDVNLDTSLKDFDQQSVRQRYLELCRSFRDTARCEWAWLFGVGGACLTQFLAQRRGAAVQPDHPGPAPSAGSIGMRLLRPRFLCWAAFPLAIGCIAISLLAAPYAVGSIEPISAAAMASISTAALVATLMPVVAVFGAIERRPFRAGFAVCCTAYLLLFGFAFRYRQEGSSGTRVLSLLNDAATSKSLFYLHDRFFSVSTPMLPNGKPDDINNPFGLEGGAPSLDGRFLMTGHSLWALLAGWLGGTFAQILDWKRRQTITVDTHVEPAAAKGGCDDLI